MLECPRARFTLKWWCACRLYRFDLFNRFDFIDKHSQSIIIYMFRSVCIDEFDPTFHYIVTTLAEQRCSFNAFIDRYNSLNRKCACIRIKLVVCDWYAGGRRAQRLRPVSSHRVHRWLLSHPYNRNVWWCFGWLITCLWNCLCLVNRTTKKIMLQIAQHNGLNYPLCIIWPLFFGGFFSVCCHIDGKIFSKNI